MKRLALIILIVGFVVLAAFVTLFTVSNRTEEARLWGFVDESGRVVVPIQYDDVDDFSNGYAAVSVGGRWGFIDVDGRMVVEPRFTRVGRFTADGIAWAEDPDASDGAEGPVGYIRPDGSWAISPRFDIATAFEEGVAIAGMVVGISTSRIGGSTANRIYAFGIINSEGSWIVEPVDDEEPDDWSSARIFSSGLAAVEVDNRGYAYVDRDGTFVTELAYENAFIHVDGFAIAEPRGGGFAVLDQTGAIVLELGVSDAWTGRDGFLSLYGSLGDEEGWFLADASGAIFAGPYESMGRYAEGRVTVETDDRWYLIDSDGNEIGERWDSMQDPGGGRVAIARTGRGFLADYSWGFADLDGRVVVEPTFNRARPFSEGRAAVAELAE